MKLIDQVKPEVLKALERHTKIEYGVDYDGRLHCESHEFRNSDDLVQMVVDKVCKLFVEADCPEDELDTTEADNHA